MNTKCPDTEQQLVDTIEPPIDHPTAASRIVELWRRDYFAQPGILAALSVLFIVYISYHLTPGALVVYRACRDSEATVKLLGHRSSLAALEGKI